jgi:hypothetical protein
MDFTKSPGCEIKLKPLNSATQALFDEFDSPGLDEESLIELINHSAFKVDARSERYWGALHWAALQNKLKLAKP